MALIRNTGRVDFDFQISDFHCCGYGCFCQYSADGRKTPGGNASGEDGQKVVTGALYEMEGVYLQSRDQVQSTLIKRLIFLRSGDTERGREK